MIQLSVVVATYRMQREAPRVVRSLMPPLQKAVADIEYEVIVIDNGSPECLDLGELTRSSHPTVSLVRVTPEDAGVSPLRAINHAVRNHAKGRFVMIMVDGARIASSHLICRTVDVLERHCSAFVFTASRHIGTRRQAEAVRDGYNQRVEDGLLRAAEWDKDLDNLYRVSVLGGCHNRSNPLRQNESNAFAVSRESWEREGGYDEGFLQSGGGWGNLEIFSRYVKRKGALNVLLLGEATFHQVHRLDLGVKDRVVERREEYRRATGEMYAPPHFAFVADLGVDYNRMASVGGFLIEAR